MSTPSKLSEDVERVIRQVDRDMNGYEAGILRSALSAQSARIKELEAALEQERAFKGTAVEIPEWIQNRISEGIRRGLAAAAIKGEGSNG